MPAVIPERHGETKRPPTPTRVDLTRAVIVLLVWENPFAKAGGLFPVASRLAGALRKLFPEVLLVSPHHRLLTTAPPLDQLERIPTGQPIRVRFEEKEIPVELFRPRDRERYPEPWVLLHADDYFCASGGSDPFSHPTAVGGWEDPLLRDALFGCAAVPHVLAGLGKKSDVVVSAHDWHFAMASLTVARAVSAGVLDSACVALTLHNCFDRYLPPSAVKALLGD
jgi:glycogen synthase